ncbi:MAG: hypothetical protein ABI905_09185 [Betaproteobacteria bacterium]
MTDFTRIEAHIRQARLQRSVELGDLISDGIIAAWSAASGLVKKAGKVKKLVQPPPIYSTSMPRRF